MLFLSSADLFFRIFVFFFKNLLGTLSECQMVWIQIRPNVLLGLILAPNYLQRGNIVV